ncbi:Ig-like domain-containing protein [Bacillus sp. FJAT-45350]|uniref:Ig-like domain-containing protein n=1 Tax=Bacillus sp. FJAT-45350 TaxID=2011014 RepID=UPI000BB7A708|nr:Ig-like domain-containing protein [Bacillus sp. FJAT-45350]
MRRRAPYFISSFLLLCVLFLPFNQAEASFTALLKEVEGEVVVTKMGGKREFSAEEGMAIYLGDTIRTGTESSVKIDFGDRNEATLGELGKVTIAELSSDLERLPGVIEMASRNGKKVGVKQQSGGLWSKVKGVFSAGDRHRVETSTAVMGVRGTLFLTYVNERLEQEYITVFDGVVGIENSKATGRTTVANEPTITIGQQASLYNEPTIEPSGIQYQQMVEQLDTALLVEIIVDSVEASEERAEQARQEADRLQGVLEEERARRALEVSKQAELLSAITDRMIQEGARATKVEMIEARLEAREQSLHQLQERTREARQRIEEARNRIERAAEEVGVRHEEIVREREALERAIQEIEQSTSEPSQSPQAPTTNTGGGGGSSNTGTTVIRVSDVKMNANSISLNLGESYQFQATVHPSNATNKAVSWESSNPSVAQVDQRGNVTAVSTGQAEITVKTGDGAKVATARVTVAQPLGETLSTLQSVIYYRSSGELSRLELLFNALLPEDIDIDTTKLSIKPTDDTTGYQFQGHYTKAEGYIDDPGTYRIRENSLVFNLDEVDRQQFIDSFLVEHTFSAEEGWLLINETPFEQINNQSIHRALGLIINVTSTNLLKVNWDYYSGFYYHIYLDGERVGETAVDENEFILIGLEDGETYEVKLEAYDTNDEVRHVSTRPYLFSVSQPGTITGTVYEVIADDFFNQSPQVSQVEYASLSVINHVGEVIQEGTSDSFGFYRLDNLPENEWFIIKAEFPHSLLGVETVYSKPKQVWETNEEVDLYFYNHLSVPYSTLTTDILEISEDEVKVKFRIGDNENQIIYSVYDNESYYDGQGPLVLEADEYTIDVVETDFLFITVEDTECELGEFGYCEDSVIIGNFIFSTWGEKHLESLKVGEVEGLTVEAKNDAIVLQWTESESYYRADITVNGEYLATPTTPYYTIIDLEPSTDYEIEVETYEGASDFFSQSGHSIISVQTTETALMNSLEASEILHDEIELSWEPVTNATEYRVFNENFVEPLHASNHFHYTFEGLIPNTDYVFRVEAWNDMTLLEASTVRYRTYREVHGVNIEENNGQVILQWEAHYPCISGCYRSSNYEIYITDSANNTIKLEHGNVMIDNISYDISEHIQQGDTYRLKIVALSDTNGQPLATGVMSYTMNPTQLDTFELSVVEEVLFGEDTLDVTWSCSLGDSYRLFINDVERASGTGGCQYYLSLGNYPGETNFEIIVEIFEAGEVVARSIPYNYEYIN